MVRRFVANEKFGSSILLYRILTQHDRHDSPVGLSPFIRETDCHGAGREIQLSMPFKRALWQNNRFLKIANNAIYQKKSKDVLAIVVLNWQNARLVSERLRVRFPSIASVLVDE